MPKETVYGSKMVGGSETEPRTPVVEVRWNRDPFVQVVTRIQEFEVPRHGIQTPVFTPEQDAALARGEVVETTQVLEPISCEYGMYVELDRHGINQLIRNLRRARDQAFGRDE